MSRPTQVIATFALLLSWIVGGATAFASARDGRQSWHEVKCARYKKAWSDALARRGTRGLGREFLQRHEAFLASDCRLRADVCPRSTEEFEFTNTMVILAMNAGTASTFPPFACRK